MGDKKNKPF